MARIGPSPLAYVLGLAALALLSIAGAGTVVSPAHAGIGSVAEQVVTEFRGLTDLQILNAGKDGASVDDFTGWGDPGQKVSTVDGYAGRFTSTADFVAEGSRGRAALLIGERVLPLLSTTVSAVAVGYAGWEIGWHIGTWFDRMVELTTNANYGSTTIHAVEWDKATPCGLRARDVVALSLAAR